MLQEQDLFLTVGLIYPCRKKNGFKSIQKGPNRTIGTFLFPGYPPLFTIRRKLKPEPQTKTTSLRILRKQY